MDNIHRSDTPAYDKPRQDSARPSSTHIPSKPPSLNTSRTLPTAPQPQSPPPPPPQNAAPSTHRTARVHFILHPRSTFPENCWARMLQRAASSNRHRHRARLERDGWAFVTAHCADDVLDMSDEESLDDEFDLVVLPRESVGC
ncbi:hypothetical protein EJ07DRAFT_170685 [Lizonia empirigonia]|nr:hypothetical protein EJ07DRAFT_170685 [Lizonia empirigonia]